MSASDSNCYFVELGEYNLIIARANLGQRPRTIEAIQEIWIGDTAGTDTALSEIRPAGSSAKAVALFRLKARGTFLATPDQAKSIVSPEAIDGFLRSSLGAENLPASWSWLAANNGLAPQNGARWALDAASSANTEESLNKLRSWSFEFVRCQSAPLTLAGGLASAAQNGPVLLLEIAEHNTTLISVSNQGLQALVTVPVGFDALAGSSQTTLGLKFRGSAARLMFNESYDFAEAATSIVEPLAKAVREAMAGLGTPAPKQLVCGGILARQTWINQALAKALNLAPFTLDAAAWANARGLTFGSGVNIANIAPSWLGVLSAASAYDSAAPGSAKAWNPLLSGTPIAAPTVTPAVIAEPPKPATPPSAVIPAIIPAILPEPAKPAAATPTAPAKPAIIPAIIQEPAKPAATAPTVPTKPAIIPAIIQEPAKPAAAAPTAAAKPAIIPAIIQEPAKPAAPAAAAPAKSAAPTIQPKPAVIITPPSKPVEAPKPATAPAKPIAPTPPPAAKPAEVKPATTTPAKAAVPAPVKPTATPTPASKPATKPEPTKPVSLPKPAPAPALSSKAATAAPFPPRKNSLPLIIAGAGIAAIIVIGAFFIVSGNNRTKAELAEKERIRVEAEAKIKAEARARAEAEKKAEGERLARQKELELAEQKLKSAQEEAQRQQDAARNSLLFGRGNLALSTEPEGAIVTVGELSPKPSPVSMKDLRLGTYVVMITLPGYDTERRNIEIKEKETTDLGTIVMKRQVGSIELNSQPSNLPYEVKPASAFFVSQNDIRTGQTPSSLTNLPIGNYQITITRANWPAYISTVTVERNATATINGEFKGATVIITSIPSGATVLRDNQIPIGTTPLTLKDVQPGNVSYTFNNRGYDALTVTGKTEAGSTLSLNGNLMEADRVMKLSELDTRPSPIAQADPDLTDRQLSDGGTALISLIVGRDGVPTEIKIEQQSSALFGKACLVAAAKWRFKPGMVRGKPVRTRVSIPFKVSGAE